jgi:hypothetical protein
MNFYKEKKMIIQRFDNILHKYGDDGIDQNLILHKIETEFGWGIKIIKDRINRLEKLKLISMHDNIIKNVKNEK